MQDASEGREGCIVISLRAAASRLRASDGREVPFTRAVLSVRNACGENAVGLLMRATLGQEGGTVQDVTHALSGLPASLPPGGSVSWDVYDLLIPAHPGTASKVHMFGHRAALNWKFELAASATYRRSPGSPPEETPLSRWVLRWSVPDPATGAVELSIEGGEE